MTQILEMSKRLQECEELIRELTKKSPPAPPELKAAPVTTHLNVIKELRHHQTTSFPVPQLPADFADSRIPISDLSLDEKGEVRQSFTTQYEANLLQALLSRADFCSL